VLSSQSERHTKHEYPIQELDMHMNKVLLKESSSFDEFLERLEDEISKDTD